jgi:2-haloacid dehalogenase
MGADERNRFKGAWSAVWEKEPCLEIFGEEMDVMAETLPEMARKVVEKNK